MRCRSLQRPQLTPDQVKWILAESTRPVSGSTAGALDLSKAFALAGAPGNANAGIVPSAGPAPGAGDDNEGALNSRAADDAASRAFDKAAEGWQYSALALEQATILDWAAVAREFSAHAHERAGALDKSALASESAAALWNRAATSTRGPWNRTLTGRRAVDAWTNASLAWRRNGDASKASAASLKGAQLTASAGWSSAGWTASAGWNSAGDWS